MDHRDEERRDLSVVANEIGLRVTVLWEDDLLEVREPQAVAVDRQHSGHARALRGADLAIGALGSGACGGTQRVLRGLATLLAGTFAWIHVRAQAAVRRVAQRALTRHLGVLHLA